MRISDYLSRDFIMPHLESDDVDGVIREVAAAAASLGFGEAAEIGERLLERERAHPTVMGSGLAIPHATIPGISGPILGIAVSPRPIDFGDEALGPVRVFFVLLSPPGYESVHIRLLARICRLGRDGSFITGLGSGADRDTIVAAVEAVDAAHA